VRLDINTDAAVNFSDKLERMSRSALPNAVRNTLNSAAFDVKQKTMPASASAEFTQRRKTFFKAKSRVGMAKGWDINQMNSKIGFIGGGDNQAVRDLEKQDRGGKIGGRKFIPSDDARVTKSLGRNVRNKYKYENIKNVKNVRDFKGNSWGARFLKASHNAGVGGFVVNTSGGSWGAILEITSLRRGLAGYKKIYTLNKSEVVSVKSTGFMRKASNKSAKKLNRFYEENAKRQIKRFKK